MRPIAYQPVFPKAKGAAAKKLVKLQAQHAELGGRGAKLRAQVREAADEVLALQKALAEHEQRIALGEPSDVDGGKLAVELAAAKARRDEPWPERLRGIEGAQRKVEQDIERHVQATFADLVVELMGDAVAAQGALTDALAALPAAHLTWQRVSNRFNTLCQVVEGMDGRDIPLSPVEQLAMEVERVLGRGVPVPAPRSLTTPEAAAA